MRRLLPLLLALCMLFAACTPPDTEPPEESPSADPDEPVLTARDIELVVWDVSARRVSFIEQAAAEFRKKYPNITITCEMVGYVEAARRLRAGERCDMITVPHTMIRELADSLDVLPSRNQEQVKNAALDFCRRSVSLNGWLYGYPVSYEMRFIPAAEEPEDGEEPDGPGGAAETPSILVWVMLVSAWSEQPDEASAFAAFMMTDEMQALRVVLTGETSSVIAPPEEEPVEDDGEGGGEDNGENGD